MTIRGFHYNLQLLFVQQAIQVNIKENNKAPQVSAPFWENSIPGVQIHIC